MTNNSSNRSTLPTPDPRADADAPASERGAGDLVAGRQALIDQALRCRAQLLGKLNQGARTHLRELAQAIGEPDALGLD